ncbi:PDF receptor isoform X2 [Eupeodes corollae]|uniref:PDF receptor isoform X2 n=1 Tax=Eupeodes corollae TaxID=290404 RepID=UPI00249030B4|nr:PDF receptor isoform X2 [Eupeodes corollae]
MDTNTTASLKLKKTEVSNAMETLSEPPLSAVIKSIRAVIMEELIAFETADNTNTKIPKTTASQHHETGWALMVNESNYSSITYSSTSPTISNESSCLHTFSDWKFSENHQWKNGNYCNWTWDQFLCWPPTPAGVLARMRCPAVGHGIDITKFAERLCLKNGLWANKPHDTVFNPHGWTNYTPCFKPDVIDLMQQLYSGGNSEVIQNKFVVAERTRTLEIIGLMLSLCALLLSLVIFCNFRSLRNNRTKIHKNLFVAMVIQVIIRLTLYLDQAIIRGGRNLKGNSSLNGIENTPYICEASYVLLEYARTAMFMWMFIEGLYLHNVVTATVLQGRFPQTVYAIIGWGTSVVMTALWAVVTAHYKSNEPCWWNYNLTPYYWILEGPRLTVILFNFFFLLNIIRVLVVKLRQSHTSDIEQVRKAVRAAAVLLPLLGITNVLHIIQAPINRSAWEFALWSYVTHFLTSFQGFFIATIYCFLNGEVRTALFKSITVYMSSRGHPDWAPRRTSMFSAGYNTTPASDGHVHTSSRYTDNKTTGNNNIANNHINSSSHSSPIIIHQQVQIRNRNHRHQKGWILSWCCRKNKKIEPQETAVPPESALFELSEQ